MILEDITLQQEHNFTNELEVIPLTYIMELQFQDLKQLVNIYQAIPSIDWLIEAEMISKMEIKCEVDILLSEIDTNIKECKNKLRNKYPIKWKIEMIKVFLKKPLTSLFLLSILIYRKLTNKK